MDRIEFTAKRNRQMGPHSWDVELIYQQRGFMAVWYHPPGTRGLDKPTLRSVLTRMVEDMALAQLSYEEWCAEQKVLTIHPESEAEYQMQRQAWIRLRALFGEDVTKLASHFADA